MLPTPDIDQITGEVIEHISGETIENPTYTYGIGIDTHKRFIQVCIIWKSGEDLKRIEKEFQTSYTDLENALSYIKEKVYGDSLEVANIPFRYTIESTGCYHLPVIQAIGNRPSVINPVLAGPTRRKTDVLDARMLAQQSMLGLWRESYILSEQAETLRCLLAMRNEATRNASRILNRLNNHALRYGHTIGREGSLAHHRPRSLIEDMCEGRIPIADCISPRGLPKAVRCIFTENYTHYDNWRKVAETYHKRTMDYVKQNEWPVRDGNANGKLLLKCLQTVPGVGEVTALTWLSVVHDPRRFASSGQIAAYCGSDPSVKVSAGKTTSHTKRKGNARLHHALKNCAAQLVRNHSEPIGQWGYGILRRHRKASWGRAINAVARRLSIMLWNVHLRAVDFTYEHYKFYLAPVVPDVPIEEMDIHERYKAMLADKGIKTTGEVARAFLTTLPQQKGIGPSCLNAVKEWIHAHEIPPVVQRPTSTDSSEKPLSPTQQQVRNFLNPHPDPEPTPTPKPPSGAASKKRKAASS